jgi:hypothetical protein
MKLAIAYFPQDFNTQHQEWYYQLWLGREDPEGGKKTFIVPRLNLISRDAHMFQPSM